jgi:hypothetical protein
MGSHSSWPEPRSSLSPAWNLNAKLNTHPTRPRDKVILLYIRFSMNNPRPRPKVHSSWRLLLALLCISLVVAFGTIQAVHVHPQGDIPHPDCPLCATAHVGAEVPSAPVTLHHVAPVISALVVVVAPTLPEVLSTFALFTRPPPVDPVLA